MRVLYLVVQFSLFVFVLQVGLFVPSSYPCLLLQCCLCLLVPSLGVRCLYFPCCHV